MPALLIKELPTIIGIAAILGVIWLIGHGIHENGRKVERAIWLERDNDRMAAQAQEFGEDNTTVYSVANGADSVVMTSDNFAANIPQIMMY